MNDQSQSKEGIVVMGKSLYKVTLIHQDKGKNGFTNRVTGEWTRLSRHVVSADATNICNKR